MPVICMLFCHLTGICLLFVCCFIIRQVYAYHLYVVLSSDSYMPIICILFCHLTGIGLSSDRYMPIICMLFYH